MVDVMILPLVLVEPRLDSDLGEARRNPYRERGVALWHYRVMIHSLRR